MFDHALYYIHKTINNWFMYSFQPEGLNSKIALTGNLFLLIIIIVKTFITLRVMAFSNKSFATSS